MDLVAGFVELNPFLREEEAIAYTWFSMKQLKTNVVFTSQLFKINE